MQYPLNLDKHLEPEVCSGMDDIRREIDHIDRTIVSLIGRRAEYVVAAAKFKTSETSVRAPERFATMLVQRREWAVAEGLNPDVIEKLYRDLVQYFISEELQHWKKGFSLDKVVPWGRSYEEYVNMFNLSDADLRQRILGCGDGPAEFNARLSAHGGHIVSFDPIYEFDASQIQSRISEIYQTVMDQMGRNQSDYVWDAISSIEDLGRIRMSAMNAFLMDFETGKRDGRYISGELPLLPFAKEQFDIALSSHFLFLYSAHLSAEFHLQALEEMLRVAREVRVFPLLTLDGKRSPHLDFVTEHLGKQGFSITVRRVPYEFQRGGNEMLHIERSPNGHLVGHAQKDA
jgi:chorismate mutase-like protein